MLAVADFTGRRAAEILFKSESLSGYFAARELARQGTTADAQSGANGAGCGINGNLAGTLDANYGKGTGMRGNTERDVVLCAATGQSNAEVLRDTSPTLNCNCEQPIVYAKEPQTVAAFMAGQAKNARSIAYSETLSPTLKGAASGLNQTPSVLCVATGQSDALAAASDELAPTLTLNHEAPYICKEQTAYGICSQSSNSMKSANPHSGIYETKTCKTLDTSCLNPTCQQGGIAVVEGNVPCEPKIARTLTARHDSSPCVDRGQNVVAIHQNQLGELRESDIAYTLGTNANATGRNSPVIAFAQNQRAEVRDLNDLAGCLAAEAGMKQQTYVMQSDNNCLTPWDTQQARIHTPDGNAPTMAGADGGGGRNPAGLVMTEIHPDVTGTLCGSGAGTSRTAGNCNETDLAIAYCLQGNMIGRADKNGPAGKGVNEEISFTLNTIDQHAVASVDCRNLYENDEMSGTLTAKETGVYIKTQV
ncbi:hypothetical protein FACS1894219_09390 [Clostridia bacterium]|nr:hypothetical protein FACS1894219_09390 [Clostridia bacterium]